MERYKLIKEVGDGTFGSVWRAINKLSGEVVAVKKMKRKYYTWEECISLREVKSLRRMNHPNIVKLKEVIRENNMLYFIFEYMECNLYQLIKDRCKRFTEAEIRNWCYQIFDGLAYMHQRGYFHRDLKPENLLVTKDIIKIADFGLARELCSQLPYTEYVSTRWYRAPEVLLQSSSYNAAVDMWAMGALMAELFSLQPLFPGSNEADEMHKICNVIGSPDPDTWAEGLHLAVSINYKFPQVPCANLSELIPSASENAINLIKSLCSWDPSKRPKAAEVLKHPFFQASVYIPPPLRLRGFPNTPPGGSKGSVELKSGRRYSNGALSSSKPANNMVRTNTINIKINGPFKSGVQRKLSMDQQESEKNEKLMKGNTVKQHLSRYQLLPKQKNHAGQGNSVVATVATGKSTQRRLLNDKAVLPSDEMAQGLARLSVAADCGELVVSSMKPLPPPPPPPPPPSLKAGGWHGSHVVPAARRCARKVIG